MQLQKQAELLPLCFFPLQGSADLHFSGSSTPSSLLGGCVTPVLWGTEVGWFLEDGRRSLCPLASTDRAQPRTALAGRVAPEPRQRWEHPSPGWPSRSTSHRWTLAGGRRSFCIGLCMGQQQERYRARQERGYCTWRQKQLCWQLLNK